MGLSLNKFSPTYAARNNDFIETIFGTTLDMIVQSVGWALRKVVDLTFIVVNLDQISFEPKILILVANGLSGASKSTFSARRFR